MGHFIKAELKRCFLSPNLYIALAICFGVYAVGEGSLGWINIVLYPSTTWVNEHNMFMTEFNPYRTLLPFPATLASNLDKTS